jgi:hypothetical protein
MISRRDFSRLLALSSSSMLLPQQLSAWPSQLAATPKQPDERFWMSVREQFLMPADLSVMNAANLCPSPAPVLESMYRATKDMDGDPSFDNRQKMSQKEETETPCGLPSSDARGHRHRANTSERTTRFERPRPEGRRRSGHLCRQPSQQQRGVAAEGEAVRIRRLGRQSTESAPRS